MTERNLKNVVVELIESDTEWREGPQLEFKRAENKVPEDMWETYSAFANSGGGLIILGVDDDGKIRGVQNASRMLDKIVNDLNNRSKTSINLCPDASALDSIDVKGHTLIVMKVRRARAQEKPVYINKNMGQTFYRRGSSDFRCSDDQLEQMVRDKSPDCMSDRMVPQTTWECIDIPSWRGYRNNMRSYKPEHPWVELDDLDLLEKLGGYKRDAETGAEGLTLAGLLMFGTDDAIRKYFPRFQINYFEYDGSERFDVGKRWADRLYPDGTWTANLYQFFFRTLRKLTESLKQPFQLHDGLFAQGDTASHEAVREALANAIVHADFYGEGGIIIRKYTDKIELTNPGSLLIPVERIYRGGVSVCRNIGLQTMFLRIGIVEKTGSGYDTMFNGWIENCLVPPHVREEKDPAQVIWTLPFVGMIPKGEEKRLREVIGYQKYSRLNLAQRLVLLVVAAKQKAGHKEIMKVLPPFLAPYQLSRILTELEQEGYLQSSGKTSGKIYSIRSDESGPVVEHRNWPESVMLVRSSKRIPVVKMQQAIVDLCDDRWVSALEMANTLNRQIRSLRHVLQLLEAKGLLELQYPDQTNHPRQAYRVKLSSCTNECGEVGS